MKQQILDVIRSLGGSGVSFVELQNRIDGFRNDGEGGWVYGDTQKNLLFWFNMSEGAVEALEELIRTKQVLLEPTNPLVYMIDGAIPNVPIAKQDRAYRSERWVPVTLKLGDTQP